MTDPRFTARQIVTAIARSRINVSTEQAAHDGVERALRAAGFEAEREARLSDRDRIDLLVEPVGIEVKVKGSRRDIAKQLKRYTEHDQIKALVLVTGAAWPSMDEIAGVPFFTVNLARGWL